MGNGLSRTEFEKIASPEAVAEFDAGVARARLAAKIAEQDAARGRPLTDAERLENLRRFMNEPD